MKRVLVLSFLLFAAIAFAQQHEAAQPQQPAQPQAQQPAEHQASEHPESSKEPAHGSNEAAGAEHDEHAQFKESASVKWFAAHTGLSLKAAYWTAVFINFLIVAGGIYLLTRSAIPAYFRSRNEAIRKGMEEARRASEESSRRLGEIEARLSRLDAEIAEMRAQSDRDAKLEEERIRAAAEEDKRKIIEAAEQEITAAGNQARRELKSFAADLAVNLAAQRIKVDSATDQALVKEFVGQMGKDGGKA